MKNTFVLSRITAQIVMFYSSDILIYFEKITNNKEHVTQPHITIQIYSQKIFAHI